MAEGENNAGMGVLKGGNQQWGANLYDGDGEKSFFAIECSRGVLETTISNDKYCHH